jgi:hypothetical protein
VVGATAWLFEDGGLGGGVFWAGLTGGVGDLSVAPASCSIGPVEENSNIAKRKSKQGSNQVERARRVRLRIVDSSQNEVLGIFY